MQTTSKFFDDFARLATGAAGAMHSVRGEMEEAFRAWLDRQLAGLDLVTREEFDAVREMAEKARAENEDLRAEIELLKKKRTTAAKKTA
ncbi:accessory factor UbiK family protein [Gimibacter soli]|uniref:Accessory factor UbiK family protein n=1 Tax=Gimibacter soli TaxID=3024400 RepID=A0AAE9XX61_9PROT|nr:accessory factor UbiK family protein [Gimibacter soli]WCL55179.1 accessory factor UbiK family protein [Gimibacter soli]